MKFDELFHQQKLYQTTTKFIYTLSKPTDLLTLFTSLATIPLIQIEKPYLYKFFMSCALCSTIPLKLNYLEYCKIQISKQIGSSKKLP